MKYLLVLLVVVLGIWLLTGRRGPRDAPPVTRRKTRAVEAAPEMLACAHCGMHVPATEALLDAAGRPFCEEAHRVAGPAR
jgi:uncharacterized protein